MYEQAIPSQGYSQKKQYENNAAESSARKKAKKQEGIVTCCVSEMCNAIKRRMRSKAALEEGIAKAKEYGDVLCLRKCNAMR